MIQTKLKPKKCKVCDKLFQPRTRFQKVCDYTCAITFAREDNERKAKKAARKAVREGRERLKTRSDWLRDAQTVFNRYIRLRDHSKPCVSCGRFHSGQYHAGHYRTVGACPELRFDESNCHKQCAPCNNHLSGNIVEYRLSLIDRVGIKEVERLEGPHDPKKYSIEEIKEIIQKYKAKIKELTVN